MRHTMTAAQTPIAQQLLAPAYVRQMRQRAALLAQADIGNRRVALTCALALRTHPHRQSSRYPQYGRLCGIATTLPQPLTVADAPAHFSLFVGKLARNKGAELCPN
jgi:hypothetical protein